MSSLASHLLSLTAAAVICAIVRMLVDNKSASGALIHLMAGLLVVSTMISPLLPLQIGDLPELSETVWAQGQLTALEGEAAARQQFSAVIKERMEAYILSEAEVFGATVDIRFPEENGVWPKQIIVSGRISPYARSRLQGLIEHQLGIRKEDQQWIGTP